MTQKLSERFKIELYTHGRYLSASVRDEIFSEIEKLERENEVLELALLNSNERHQPTADAMKDQAFNNLEYEARQEITKREGRNDTKIE